MLRHQTCHFVLYATARHFKQKFRLVPSNNRHGARSTDPIASQLKQNSTMSKPGDDNNANNGNKEMKGLVVAAAMIAAGDGSTKQSSGEAAAKKTSAETSASAAPTTTSSGRGKKPKDVTASRARRLEQNRRAAIESRRRKKVMIGELQRSITFYTKANENLAYDNQDLGHKLFIARNQVLEMGGNVPDVTILNVQPTPVASSAVVELKSPPEDVKMPAAVMSNTHNIMELKPPAESSQHDEQLQQNQPQQQPIAPPAIAIPFPPLNPSVSPDHSQLAATLQTMGYPSDAARVAANAYTQFVVPIGGVPSTTNVLNAASSNRPDVPVQQQLPTEEEVGSDKYIECLQQVCRTVVFFILVYIKIISYLMQLPFISVCNATDCSSQCRRCGCQCGHSGIGISQNDEGK